MSSSTSRPPKPKHSKKPAKKPRPVKQQISAFRRKAYDYYKDAPADVLHTTIGRMANRMLVVFQILEQEHGENWTGVQDWQIFKRIEGWAVGPTRRKLRGAPVKKEQPNG